MAMIQICDTCNTKIEGRYYILTIDESKGIEYVNTRKCRYEICSDCFDALKTFLACMRSDADTIINIIAGDNHDES